MPPSSRQLTISVNKPNLKAAMNTTTYIRPVAVMENSISAQKALKAKEELTKVELAKKEAEEIEATSQERIKNLCDSIQPLYHKLTNARRHMEQAQGELDYIVNKESPIFYASEDEIYKHVHVDTSILPTMKIRKLGYYLLPAVDCILAFMAILPIVTWAVGGDLGPMQVVVGAVGAIILGIIFSILGRISMSGLVKKDSQKEDNLRWLKVGGAISSVFVLPIMYVISEITFNGGEKLAYTIGFGFVSLIIQSIMISQYEAQVEAINYFQDLRKAKDLDTEKKAAEHEMEGKTKAAKDKVQNIMNGFEQNLVMFDADFRHLTAAVRDHIRITKKTPSYELGQHVIAFGNIYCYRRIALNFITEEDGAISVMGPVELPGMEGAREIFQSPDFVNLNYMMKYVPNGIDLTPTAQAIEAGQQKLVSSPVAAAEVVDDNEPSPAPDEDDDDGAIRGRDIFS